MSVPLVMAGLGLAGQYFGGQQQANAANSQAAAQREALANAQGQVQSGYSDISQLYNPYTQTGQQAFQQYAEGDFTSDPGQFEYGRSIGDFLDPSMQFQMDQSMNQIQGSAAAGGSLGSGATLKAMQDRGQQIAQQGYGQAHDRMMQDKNFAYSQFLNDAQARQMQLQQQGNQLQNVANMGFQATQNQANNRQQMASASSGLAQQQGNIMTPGYASGMQNAALINAATNPTMIGSVMGGFSPPPQQPMNSGNIPYTGPTNSGYQGAPGFNTGGISYPSQQQPMSANQNFYNQQGLV
jgi:hypothetical protein